MEMSWFCQILLPAVALDWLLGDPHWMPHPVRWMGRMIGVTEKLLRRNAPKSPNWERFLGILLVLLVAGTSYLGGWWLVRLSSELSPYVGWGLEVWLTYQLLAARSLHRESMAVYPLLKRGELEQARCAVSRIVGRDTQSLDESGVARAAVETVAENTSDGVIAPIVYLVLGGLPLGMLYKAVNTMDSMVGYRSRLYLYFGWAAARTDDLLNLIPARLSGCMMCFAAGILPGCSGQGAWRIFLRDRKKHKSPNSAHTEAACAGALGVALAGDASYFGALVKKPVIGDDLRRIQPEDIRRSNALMYGTELLTLVSFGLLMGWRI